VPTRDLTTRVLTALTLFAVVVGVLFFDRTGIGVKALLVLMVGISLTEWANITKIKSPLWLVPAGAFCLASIIGISQLPFPHLPYWSCLGLPIAGALVSNSTKQHEPIGKVLFSNAWLILTLVPIILLSLPSTSTHLNNSPVWIMFAAVPIWVGDSMALFVGKAWGKTPLAPTISPKKTREGAIGNLLGCLISGLVLALIYKVPLGVGLCIGVNCGIIGQIGDLFQSHLKRMADLKDSGSILPGHGGLLDRIDSLMTSVPVSLAILHLFGLFSVVAR
jgi:phosphatidate cytidylyltransferase